MLRNRYQQLLYILCGVIWWFYDGDNVDIDFYGFPHQKQQTKNVIITSWKWLIKIYILQVYWWLSTVAYSS